MPLCSLNEHWGVAYKAARAAGLDWGLAEESARGCMCLASYRLPFLLPMVLSARRRKLLTAPQIDMARGTLYSESGRALCPLLSGVLLADCASCCNLPWQVQNVSTPLLLIPFMMRAANVIQKRHRISRTKSNSTQNSSKVCLRLSWAGVVLYADGHNLWSRVKNLRTRHANVKITLSAPPRYKPLIMQAGSALIPATDWREMQHLAAQTFVAASAESRQGAGAGDVDND